MSIISKIKTLCRSKVTRNSLWIIGEQVFQMAISMVIGIISARYLGPSNFGTLNYTASFVSFCTSIATLGMDGVVIQKMIASPEHEGEYLGSCMFLRLVSALVCSLGITLIVSILNPGDKLKLWMVALQSVQLMALSVHILNAWFRRYLQSKYVSIAKSIACVIVAGYRIYLLATQKSILWFAFSNSFSYLIIAIVLVIAYKKNNSQKLKVNIIYGINVLKDSYHFILSGLMVAIYGQMDKIMIQQMLTDEAVGFYTTATAVCAMWVFVPNAIISSVTPKIMELKQQGHEEEYIRRLRQTYSLIIWMSIFVSAAISISSREIITFLYGEKFLGATDALRIAIWYETFSMIGNARGIWILCEKKNKYVKYYLGIGAIINLVLNALLIPIWGIQGAATATLVTQVFTAIINPMFFRETRIHTIYVLQAFLLKDFIHYPNRRKM